MTPERGSEASVARALIFGSVFAAGLGLVVYSGPLSRSQPKQPDVGAGMMRASAMLGPMVLVQIIGALAGVVVGWAATELVGMAMLLGGLGTLLPPFMAAPARRRTNTRRALAWSLWSRQLAELARAGSGLTESLRGSMAHAPREVAPIAERIAATAELYGLEAALDELAEAGKVWEPEVAAGLRMAAMSGGAVADPLLNLCGRIGDVVELHRAKTEAVVQLWTQTIALLGLAGGTVMLMYRNNPAYFEPYESGTGQMVLVCISGLLLLSTAFLVYHSVVREENSVLVPPRRRSRAKEPL